jgi:ribosomal protein S19E (S16A)
MACMNLSPDQREVLWALMKQSAVADNFPPQVLQTLEAAGLVSRKSIWLDVTPKGLHVLQQQEAALRAAADAVLVGDAEGDAAARQLTAEDWVVLQKMSGIFVGNIKTIPAATLARLQAARFVTQNAKGGYASITKRGRQALAQRNHE